jgi:hypothetical protein
MNLKKSTKINAVMFYDNKTNNVIGSTDMNITFDDYNKKCKKNGVNLKTMYNFNFTLNKTVMSNEYIFKLYSYSDNRYNCSYIELNTV